MRALGVTAREIDVTPACRQMLTTSTIRPRAAKPIYDATYENVQAGARTSLLFRLANQNDALVLGTGDLSELALGWCTYGVGDQMSHYNVNASVPKTLIQHLIRWCARDARFGAETVAVLAGHSRDGDFAGACAGRRRRRRNAPRISSGPMRCRTSIYFMRRATASRRRRSPFSRFAHGATRATASWPSAVPRRQARRL